MTAARKHKQPTLAEIGQGAYSSIVEMVERLRRSREDVADDGSDLCQSQNDNEAAERAIQEDAMSAQVRSGWFDPGAPDVIPEEYCLLLAWGGPAVRIVGELSSGEPSSARLETQDWGTPWTEYHGVEVTRGKRKGELDDCPDEDVLLDYARCFYFGEG